MYKYDVTGTTPVLLLQTPFGTVGSNGEDLTLTHDGSSICYTAGSGNNNYDIAKFRTSDFAELGSFSCGPYPQALGFSPDDLVAYASVNTASGIKAFDANTFLLLGMMTGPDVASKLAVDSTGRELFAGYDTYFGFLGNDRLRHWSNCRYTHANAYAHANPYAYAHSDTVHGKMFTDA